MTPSNPGIALVCLGALASSVAGAGCSSSDEAARPAAQVSATPDASGPPVPVLPALPDTCPELRTTSGVVDMLGLQLQLWVGEKQTDKQGPVLFYWHGTNSHAGEAPVFMQSQIDEIVADGGMVVSFETSTGTGTYSGPFVWYTDDFNVADTLLACANAKLNLDTRRIFVAGCSAGGLQTGAMTFARSSYIAAAMTSSGGHSAVPELEDPNHVPAIMTTHGSYDADVVILHFSDTSHQFDQDIVTRGGFAVDCEHPNGHCGVPKEVVAAQWQYLKDHPFGTTADPYADGLPTSFPSYCTKVAAAGGP